MLDGEILRLAMSEENAEIVRRVIEVINSSGSVDEAMAALDALIDPEAEWVNPEDAVERGIRKGRAGMRTVIENFVSGAGGGMVVEVEDLQERGGRVFSRSRIHLRGELSGAEAVGPPVGAIYTIRGGRVVRIEWHSDVDEAIVRFEQAAAEESQGY